MTPDFFQLFFSLLTLGALAGIVVVLVALLVRQRVPAAAVLVEGVARQRMAISAVVTLTAMLGSLYFSEAAHYVPCTLCWYQRIAMYPIAVIASIAALRRDDLRVYIGVIAAAGAGISLYHWLLERFPDLDAGVCSATVPCEFVWFEQFGFMTLPFMALTAFASVLVVIALPRED